MSRTSVATATGPGIKARRLLARALLAAATLTATLGAPSTATAIPRTQISQCKGTVAPGGAPGTCTATFDLDESRYPQDIGTHANFHALTSVGSVKMEWFNQVGKRVAVWSCSAPGLFVHRRTLLGEPIEAGPTDASSHTCVSSILHDAYFATGPQLLVVTAQARMCDAEDSRSCPFHGYLALRRATEPA